MGLLDDLFGGTQTPWSKSMMEQMTGGNPAPMPATQGRMGVGVAPPPRPETEPTARAAAPDLGSSGGIGGAEILGALLQGAGGIAGPLGRLVSQSSERERNDAQKNDTYKFFVKNGVPEETAAMAIRNPELGKHLLSKFFAPKQKPDLVEVPDEFGNPTKMVFNPTTGKLDPVSSLMPEQPAAASAVVPDAVSQPQAMMTPEQPQSGPAAVLEAPGAAAPNLGTDAGGMLAGLSGAAAKMPSEVMAQSQPAQAAAATAPQAAPNTIVGPASKNVAEGYVHKAAPDGRGYLYDAATKRPIAELKAEVDARAKGTEKKALEKVDQDLQINGVKSMINDARSLTDAPGFEGALTLGNASLNLGIPTPWGFVGGDVMTPSKQLARIWDKTNPAHSTADSLTSLQQQLNLVVARPLLKGQGNVSNAEREMISEAIGGLSKATSKADFQFRLNNVENMIEAMNGGGSVTSASVDRRPTQTEITSAIDINGKYGAQFKPGAIDALAQKYKVKPNDMQEYINGIFKRQGGE